MLHVLILAAGLGTRLRPLTENLPKPLVQVVDASILSHQVRFAKTLGNVELHVNAHYLASQIEGAAKELGIGKVWFEEELLGTGGPIHRIAKAGNVDELLVLNGDCYCALDLNGFLIAARNSKSSVALLARDFPKVNTLQVKDSKLSGIAGRFGTSGNSNLTFSGISWYSKGALNKIQETERDIRDFWKRLIENAEPPFVYCSESESLWIDMGSPLGLFQANKARLAEIGEKNWIAPEIKKQYPNLQVGENVVIHSGVELSESVTLDNAILFPGSKLEANEICKNQIRGENFLWSLE